MKKKINDSLNGLSKSFIIFALYNAINLKFDFIAYFLNLFSNVIDQTKR